MTPVAAKSLVAASMVSDPEACELTIVLPCLNEAETLGACVEKAIRALLR